MWSVNHWTTREVQEQSWIKSDVKNQRPLCWIQPASAFLGSHRVLNIGAIQKWRIAHQIWIFSFSWETRVSGNRGSPFLKLARAELRFLRALWFTPCQSSPRTEAKIRCSVSPSLHSSFLNDKEPYYYTLHNISYAYLPSLIYVIDTCLEDNGE